ncbi:hypothetical protein ACOMICROBIO_GDFFDHBD_02145 [Vibrio sp. B1REV9]|nr:hypothetical protein ACOMICROBIO_GDFFDHBD_02145 [Vibrio sp. B1REV9]
MVGRMNKIVMLLMGLLFTSRLFASIVPHASQLEHDAPILIRSILIVGVAGVVIWKVCQYFQNNKSSD